MVEDVVTVVPEGRAVYGMQLPIQSQSTLYTAEWETRAGPAELARVARAADEAGYFYLGVCDHTAIPVRLAEAMSTVWYDTTATLGWLAGVTTRARLLSHVLILAQRHPLRAAKELCTIDLLSDGRLIVGVGAGHVAEEYELLTGGFEQRGRHTDEAVASLAVAFRDEYPELPGPRWPASGMGVAPRPVQRPARRSGSGGPAGRPSAGPPPWATAGCPRGPGAATCPGRSPGCGRCATSCGAGRRSTSGPSSSPSTWPASRPPPTPAGSTPPTSSPAVPRRSPGRCGSWWPWASTTSRSASWPRSVEELCDQTSAFGEQVGPLING